MSEYREQFQVTEDGSDADYQLKREVRSFQRCSRAFCIGIAVMWLTYLFCFPLIEPAYRSPLLNPDCAAYSKKCRGAEPCMKRALHLCRDDTSPCYHNLVDEFCNGHELQTCLKAQYYCGDRTFLKGLVEAWEQGGARLSYREHLLRIFTIRDVYRLNSKTLTTEYDRGTSAMLIIFTCIIIPCLLCFLLCTS